MAAEADGGFTNARLSKQNHRMIVATLVVFALNRGIHWKYSHRGRDAFRGSGQNYVRKQTEKNSSTNQLVKSSTLLIERRPQRQTVVQNVSKQLDILAAFQKL